MDDIGVFPVRVLVHRRAQAPPPRSTRMRDGPRWFCYGETLTNQQEITCRNE